MIISDYEVLARECERRGWDMDKLLELAGAAPFLGLKKIPAKNGNTKKQLTYCGKTREQWNRKNK